MYWVNANSVTLPVSKGEWVCAIATYNGSRIEMYINGVQAPGLDWTTTVNTSANLILGKPGHLSSNYLGTSSSINLHSKPEFKGLPLTA